MVTISLTQIKKRSGDVVEFNTSKIKVAIEKAYVEVKGSPDAQLLEAVTDIVLLSLAEQFEDRIPSVEDVQNTVERELMGQGLFDVAKAYIIYRYEHAKIREQKKQETLRKIDTAEMMVIKRDGTKQPFSLHKLEQTLRKLMTGYEAEIDVEMVLNQCRLEVHEDMKTSDIERALIMVLRSFIEQDPAYSYVAAKALFYRTYKRVLGHEHIGFDNLHEQIKNFLPVSIQNGVAIGKLDPRLLTFDFNALSAAIKPERDGLLDYLSAQTLIDRYFIQNPETKALLEVPQIFWMRVAMGLAINEPNKNERAIEFYSVMSTLHFVPSTPTLFHAGTAHPQLSSCYLTTIEDSLDHIFKCIADNAQLSKWSGGIGNDWTPLRATGALIRGTGVESQGIIPFLKIANDTTIAINRSGKRRGATCAYLETWHYDIEDFLELRKNTGDERRRTHDMNTANWIPDLFMQRVKSDGFWTLFSPDEVPDLHHLYGRAFQKRYEQYEAMAEAGQIRLFKKLKAKDLWRKMLTMLFETGHPWITFKDPSNIRSPQDHAGVVHNSNLCTEITLNTSADETAVCNLGSVNLGKHIVNGQLDEKLIQFTVTTAMRMLDNVVDLNFYPTIEAKNSNLRHRPVGLGVMGFHDALYKLDYQFDSEAAVQFADQSMELISYYAILSSSFLAKERGSYSSFRGSKWDRGLLPLDTLALLEQERGVAIDVPRTATKDWAPVRAAITEYGMRNSNCMAIAPTATISNISSCIPGIEPIYKNIYVKSNQSGDFTVVNEYLIAELKRRNLWNAQLLSLIKFHDGNISEIADIPQDLKDKFKEVFQIDPRWLIRAAAYRGKWIDQSQSLNIFYAGKSGKEISDIYLYAWDMGLKTTYYLRTMGVSQVEKSTVNTTEHGSTHVRKGMTEAVAETPVVAEEPAGQQPLLTPEPVVAAQQPIGFTLEVAGAPVAAASAPVNAFRGGLSVADAIAQTQVAFKACRLDNPTCEACQ